MWAVSAGWGQPVYAVGILTAQTPTVGVEKELAQLTAGVHQGDQVEVELLQQVLRDSETAYIGWHLSWVFTSEGVDTFTVLPRTEADLARLAEVLSPAGAEEEVVHAVVGQTVPCLPDAPCAVSGLPTVHADQVLAFTLEDFAAGLPGDEKSANERPGAARGAAGRAEFEAVVRRLFRRLTGVPGNHGLADEHRARNYLALRYPAIYHVVRQAEAEGKVLVGVDARHSHSADGGVVAVRLTVRNPRTDLTEHYQCLVNVRESFPFLITGLQPVY
jgi:PatG C-terminal/PatG Domain